MCVAVSGNFITHCRCACTSLDQCLSLFLSECLSLFGYVVTNCTCIGTSLNPRFSLSLFLSVSLSVSGYIIGNLHVCEQARSAGRPRCDCAKERLLLFCFVLFLNMRVRLLIDISYFLFRAEWLYQFSDIFWLIVCPSTSLGCVCFSHFSLNICSSDWLYYHSLYVSMSVAWFVFVSLSLPLSMPIAVFGYILTDCSSIGTWSAYVSSFFFSSFFFISVNGYIIGNSAGIGTSLHWYFSLSHCIWMCLPVSG